MAYNAMDYQKMVEDFVKTPKGKGEIQSQIQNKKTANKSIGYSVIEMKRIAENLKNEIISEFSSLVYKDPRPEIAFSGSNVIVSNPMPFVSLNDNGDTSNRITITFKDEALHRSSLWEEGYPDGAYDIIGLFTNGYRAGASVSGQWLASDGDTVIDYWTRSLKSRVGNDFVKRVANKYEAMYPGLKVELPDEWV